MELQTCINEYLAYCKSQKRLDGKTLKAYRIDLTQFSEEIRPNNTDSIIPIDITTITAPDIEEYISSLHQNYKPKTVKRKIASAITTFDSHSPYLQQPCRYIVPPATKATLSPL